MRDSAASARVFARAVAGRGVNPGSHPRAANGSRLVSRTDRSSKAKGFRDVGNGQSTVLTNLCAPHAHLGSGPEIPRAYSLSLDATYPTARAKSVIAIGGG